jgi:hypothetical protein
MQQKQVAVVFYSKYCPHSEKFLGALKDSGQDSSISKFICVDKQSNGQRPLEVKNCGITEVPTVICDAKLLPGIKAFKWLVERIKQANRGSRGTISDTRDPGVQIRRPPQVSTVSGVESSSQFGGGRYSELGAETSIAGETAYVSEEQFQKQETPLIYSETITGAAGPIKDEDSYCDVAKRDSLKAKQLDNAYSKLMRERGI